MNVLLLQLSGMNSIRTKTVPFPPAKGKVSAGCLSADAKIAQKIVNHIFLKV